MSLRKFPYWYLLAVPVLLFALGAALNQIVLIANHGTFPVQANKVMIMTRCVDPDDMPEQLKGVVCQTDGNGGQYLDFRGHVIMTDKTHLNFLADIFDLGDGIYSIGDFLLMLGQLGLNCGPIAWVALVIRKNLVS